MDQLLPTLAPSDLLDANAPATSDSKDEAALLFEERETEKAGGAPRASRVADTSALRPELLAQLEHVRAMLSG